MKIRDLILSVLILGMVISTGVLVAFASMGISDIKDTTSEASSGELLSNASKNLQDVAISIRDSLDSQMQTQYEMVKAWAREPAILDAARDAQSYSKEDLFEMWSAAATRQFTDGKAVGDMNPDNDLSPALTKYLDELPAITYFREIVVTDSRGYTIATNVATEDFDQGPDDWNIVLVDGTPVFMMYQPNDEGEDWYLAANAAQDRFWVSDIIFDETSRTWGLEIVSQIRDPETDEYLGQIKTVFDYNTFISQFVNIEKIEVYEIKVANIEGLIVATSLEDKSKVNNESVNIKDQDLYWIAVAEQYGNISEPFIDENGESVYAGFARSRDYNRHTVIVAKKEADVAAPINEFIGTLQSNIGDKSSALQRNMIIIGAVVAVAIIIAAAIIMRAKVSIPLKKLTTVSEKLSKGEIEGLEIDIKGKDEISTFGESFKGVLAAFNFLKDEAEKKQ